MTAEKFQDKIHLHRTSNRPCDLSIIIPVYNTEDYIVDTLKSIVSALIVEFELIIVDDGSVDNSKQVILDWLEENKVNVVFFSQKNAGLGAARNSGVKFAKGKYIAFFDSDDYAISATYNLMIAFAEKNSLELIISRARCFNNTTLDTFPFGDVDIINAILDNNDFIITNAMRDGRLLRVEPSAVIRVYLRKFFLERISYFPEGISFEDLAPHVKSVVFAERIGVLNEYLLLYRVDRAGQLTSASGRTRFDILQSVSEVIQSDCLSCLDDRAGAYLCGSLARIVSWCASECNKENRVEFFEKYLKLVESIPYEWWLLYGKYYAENETLKEFCNLTIEQDAWLLADFMNSGFKVVQRADSTHGSGFQIIIKRIILNFKHEIIPCMQRLVYKLKHSFGVG